jgi:hypothetical protein
VAEQRLGRPLALTQTTAIATLVATPEAYVGKVVQVKGQVREVCQKRGCWMMLADGEGKLMRIKVRDGEIVFPKASVGKTARAEGKFLKIELTREQVLAQAKHEAEENGKKFDPAAITAGKTLLQIQGTGAVIE